MVEIAEFRTARVKLGSDYLPFVVEACIDQAWENLSFPVYLDSEAVRTVPTLKKIVAHLKRSYTPSSPLHAALDGVPLTLEFVAGGETHEFSEARVVEWKITGELGGDMVEHVAIACEEAA